MAPFTPQEKVLCFYWLAEFKFPVTVQRKFRGKYPGREVPNRHTILWSSTSICWNVKILNDIAQEVGGKLRQNKSNVYVMLSQEVLRTQSDDHPDMVHKRLKLTAYKGRWIGHSGPIPWFPMISRFNPSGLFLLGLCQRSCLQQKNQ